MSAADRDLIAAWQVGPVRTLNYPASGAINRTILVETSCGRYVLRAYRHHNKLPIVREHAAIAYACTHGVPAVAPLPLPGGSTILMRHGRYYALFPHAPGGQLRHQDLTNKHYVALGAFLAQLHQALLNYPQNAANQRILAIKRQTTLVEIDQLIALIDALPTPSDFDHMIRNQLAQRRAWIVHSPYHSLPYIPSAPQLIHGDYQESNLFWHEQRITAIIDWDQTYLAPRAWEVARVLDLVCAFALESARTFLAGYRAHITLDDDELDRVMYAYGLVRAHDLWLYREIYCEHNPRIRQFVPAGAFVPLTERWAALKELL